MEFMDASIRATFCWMPAQDMGTCHDLRFMKRRAELGSPCMILSLKCYPLQNSCSSHCPLILPCLPESSNICLSGAISLTLSFAAIRSETQFNFNRPYLKSIES